MVVRPFAAQFPQLGSVAPTTAFFQQVKVKFPNLRDRGFYPNHEEEAMYVYEIEYANGQSMLGLLAAVSIHEYLEERVCKHEHTLVSKEETQANLMQSRKASVKPVLLAHRPHKGLADLLETYTVNTAPKFTITLEDTGEMHRFWSIHAQEDLELIQFYFAEHITTTYIADGHHRFSAAARLYQRLGKIEEPDRHEYLMCMLMPSTTLQIHNFNRIIKAFTGGLSPLSFMVRLSHYAKIEPLTEPEESHTEHELTCYLEGEWFKLRWHETIINKYANAGLPIMDVSMLNYCILEEILNFENIRNDKRVKYVEGPRGLKALMNLTDSRQAVAFCLFPLSWESFFLVIDHGLVLPPKSTWFEPRMLNGIVVQPFE